MKTHPDRGKPTRVLVWFSCGVTSAVAGKLALAEFPDAEVLYCDTGGEHPDNVRFMRDVARWYKRDITVLRNPKYADVWDVFEKEKLLATRIGAPCTRHLKRRVREAYQRPGDLHVFGFDCEESERVDTFSENNPDLWFWAPLLESHLNKPNCKALVERAGIALPAMYLLGYPNNNCVGCVKGKKGYWNRIRIDFPDVFARMSALERKLDQAVINDEDGLVFLDELPPDAGNFARERLPECDVLCEIAKKKVGL